MRARILLAYLKAYHPKEYALFISSLGDVLQSFESERYVDAVLRYGEGFLLANPEDQERLQSISPREMIEEVGQQLVEDAGKRRGDIRLRAREIVNKYIHGTTTEKQVLEDKLVASISASISRAETPQQLRRAIEEEVAMMPLPAKEVVQQLVDTDPLSAQHLLLTNPARDSIVIKHITDLPALAWRGYIAAVENLQMGPNETFEEHTKRAKEIGQTAAFLSADLSQTPAARAEPSSLISAILEATGNKSALITNSAAITIVSKSWNAVVEAITQRAGGVLTPALQLIINQGNKQWENIPKEPLGRVASLVGDVINPLLGRTFTNLVELEALNRLLPPGRKILPEKTGAFIASPQELFLLTAYTWKPEGVVFNLSHPEGSLEPAVWSVRWAADSVIGKIFNRTVKSEGAKGFFGKILGLFGFRVGAQAAAGAAGGLIKIFGSLVGALSGPWGWAVSIIGGLFAAPLFNKVKNWFSNLLSGRIGKLGAAQDAIIGAFGGRAGGRSAQEEQKKTDFYIALLVGVPIIILITATMFQITVRDSALFVASFPSNTGGPYIESFPPYYGPFPEESPPLASCPVSSAPITQKPFGDFSHEGVCAYDFGSQKGALVYATHDGCVAALRSDVPNDTFIEGEFGNYVRLAGTSPTGHYYTIYAHLVQGSGLSAGTCVKAGGVIGRVDTTGFTFDSNGHRGGGTHLHYQYNDDQKTCPSLPTGCGY